MKVKIVKELSGFRGAACLVKRGKDYFAVSSIASAFDHGDSETMAFRCNSKGEVVDWMDVAGGRGATRESVISELENEA